MDFKVLVAEATDSMNYLCLENISAWHSRENKHLGSTTNVATDSAITGYFQGNTFCY